MNNKIIITLAILITLNAHSVYASGTRSELITQESIKKYAQLSINQETLPENSLNYVGTVDNKLHVFMKTKTTYSKRKDGGIGMPWDHVFKYTVPVKDLTITNGWDITPYIKNQGLRVWPSFCPNIYLTPGKNAYVIPASIEIKENCIEKGSY